MTKPNYYLNIKDLSRDVQRLGSYYFNYGEFADIWKASWGGNQARVSIVAVKALRGVGNNQARKNEITKSLLDIFHVWNYLTMLGHPNIVPFYGFTMDISSGHLPSIVIPLYQNGNALSYIEAHPKADKLRLIMDIACALDYLHNLPTAIVHGDLKASNVLVTDDGRACLTDIGLASIVSQEDFTSAKIAGNCRWSPPEVLDPPMTEEGAMLESPPTPAGDVYSWGMTALEIFTGQHPFSHRRNDAAVIFDVLKGLRPHRPAVPEVTEGLWNIWTDCWVTEPKQRPTMDSVLAELGVCLP
ncbi:kinase-like protein [Rickenella mellea]|uniref:Kinase-like protein n=1 Tax=Rickenella mellea TaxID=50990 RepID=A0A4Y7Q8E0_9AGAM|nr:kinase-like protein [Rickenella mellea]